MSKFMAQKSTRHARNQANESTDVVEEMLEEKVKQSYTTKAG